MKMNIMKFLVAAFAFVAIMAVAPTLTVNASTASDVCVHTTTHVVQSFINPRYYFIDYNIHLIVSDFMYQCDQCGERFVVEYPIHEEHYYDGNGLCICGTYNDKDF